MFSSLRYIQPCCLSVFGAQVAPAEHRGEGDGNQAGNQNGGNDDDGEFVEQASEDAGHEEDRQKDDGERQSHRENREADFLRAIERGLERSFAHLHVAHDVFEHDDGVIDDEAHR